LQQKFSCQGYRTLSMSSLQAVGLDPTDQFAMGQPSAMRAGAAMSAYETLPSSADDQHGRKVDIGATGARHMLPRPINLTVATLARPLSSVRRCVADPFTNRASSPAPWICTGTRVMLGNDQQTRDGRPLASRSGSAQLISDLWFGLGYNQPVRIFLFSSKGGERGTDLPVT
jgi:hypothetical protein